MSAEVQVIDGEVIEAELVPLAEMMPTPPQHLPAVRVTHPLCACGKDGSDYAHGAINGRRPFACDEILQIRARVNADLACPTARLHRVFNRVFGGRL